MEGPDCALQCAVHRPSLRANKITLNPHPSPTAAKWFCFVAPVYPFPNRSLRTNFGLNTSSRRVTLGQGSHRVSSELQIGR